MEPDAGGDALGDALRQCDGRARRTEVLAHADDDEAYDPRRSRTLHHGIGAFREVVGVEMAMGIDERERHGRRSVARASIGADPAVPSLDACYLVFSQSKGGTRDVPAWDAHAARFFDTRLRAGEGDEILVALGSDAAEPRRVTSRAREPEDLALADRAEARTGGGLGLLAHRCPTVWLVERQAEEDAVALRLAAILASVLLGPILDARVPELLGVKSARERLSR